MGELEKAFWELHQDDDGDNIADHRIVLTEIKEIKERKRMRRELGIQERESDGFITLMDIAEAQANGELEIPPPSSPSLSPPPSPSPIHH